MSHKYLKLALPAYSQRVRDKSYIAWAGKILSTMNDGQINALNNSLNHGIVRHRTISTIRGGVSRQGVLNEARAAKLLLALRAQAGMPVNQADRDRANALDQTKASQVFQAYTNGLAPDVFNLNGNYIQGSFWAFANDSEIRLIRSAWAQAQEQLRWGINVAVRANIDGGAAAETLRRWFGSTSSQIVSDRLKVIERDISQKSVGMCYQGPNASGNNDPDHSYQECKGNVLSEVSPDYSVIAWAAPADHNYIGFCVSYFSDTKAHMLETHNPDLIKGGIITQGGAVVHELSHRYLSTIDTESCGVDRPDYYHSVAKIAGKNPLPNFSAYGAALCSRLAKNAPNAALNNADNYRLFCEDASIVQYR
jgi:hypothetical protein